MKASDGVSDVGCAVWVLVTVMLCMLMAFLFSGEPDVFDALRAHVMKVLQ